MRELAVQGLNAAGAEAVPAVWARLTGSADQVVAAAQVLATHPDSRSVAPLEAAVALAQGPDRPGGAGGRARGLSDVRGPCGGH